MYCLIVIWYPQSVVRKQGDMFPVFVSAVYPSTRSRHTTVCLVKAYQKLCDPNFSRVAVDQPRGMDPFIKAFVLNFCTWHDVTR